MHDRCKKFSVNFYLWITNPEEKGKQIWKFTLILISLPEDIITACNNNLL